MGRRLVGYALVMVLGAALAGSANAQILHKMFMSGQILDARGGMAYLCMGSATGAKVGQELPVFRYARTGVGRAGAPIFSRKRVGSIKITQIVDGHMARAKVISGRIKEHDMAELEQ